MDLFKICSKFGKDLTCPNALCIYILYGILRSSFFFFLHFRAIDTLGIFQPVYRGNYF